VFLEDGSLVLQVMKGKMMTTQQNGCQVQLIVDGQPLKSYQDGAGTSWLEATEGKEWSLRVHVPSTGRQLVVAAVDGLSVMDGKPSDGSPNGYIVSAGKSYIDIPGYRLDNDSVAKFFFSGAGESYAEKMGHGENTGVIGVRVFDEQSVAPQASLGLLGSIGLGDTPKGITRGGGDFSSDLGTGFGERVDHKVRQVNFTAKHPVRAEFTLGYASEQRLIEAGVKRPIMPVGNPFPAAEAKAVGCTPPGDWSGAA